jgi:magnesium transporter
MSAARVLAERYIDAFPADVARRVDRLRDDELGDALAGLPADSVAALLPHLAQSTAARVLADLPVETASDVAAALPLEQLATLARVVSAPARARLLEALPAPRAAAAASLLEYAPQTAGALMDPEVLTIPIDATVADARALIALRPQHLYYYLYALDSDGRLAGVIDIAELMQAADGPVRAIVATQMTWLAPATPLSALAVHPAWRDYDALPVAGDERRFLGVLRHRRVRQLVARETTDTGDARALDTVVALGEVFWLGLCGMLQGLSTAAAAPADGGER